MEDLRWIFLALGALVLVLLGLYLFSRKRRDDAVIPFNNELKHDPLEAAQVAQRAEPHIDITDWCDEGVGPVCRRSLDEIVISSPRSPTCRTPRFSYEIGPKSTASGVQPLQAVASATEPPAASSVPNHPVSEQADEAAHPAVVPIYLVARDPQGFAGSTLIDVFARYGFEFGKMDVYHYIDSRGHTLFSLMNGVAPGTFDPATLPDQHTPALAMFLRLPIPAQPPSLVFEQFLDIAYRLAEELNAMLLDERREELSTESIDRMREIALKE